MKPSRSVPPILYPAMVLQYAIGGAYLPFITLYLRDKGMGYIEIGWIFLASAASGSTLPFLWGYIADRWVPLERLMAALHGVGALALLLLHAQSKFLPLLAAFAFVSGIYFPTNGLFSALSYHNIESPEREFGRLRLWGSVGWMLPSLPVLLWMALVREVHYGFTMYIAAATEGFMALVSLLLPHTPPAARGGAPFAPESDEALPAAAPLGYGIDDAGPQWQALEPDRGAYKRALRSLVRRPGLPRLLSIIFLMHGSMAIVFYYSPPLLDGAGFTREWIGPLQCVGVVMEVPFFFLLPWALAHMGFRGTIAAGCGALLVRQLCYAFSGNAWVLTLSYVLVGSCVVFYLTAVSLALNAMAGSSVRATAQSFIVIVGLGLGQMFGHRVAGVLAAHPGIGLPGVFLFATATTGIALILAVSLRESLFTRTRTRVETHASK